MKCVGRIEIRRLFKNGETRRVVSSGEILLDQSRWRISNFHGRSNLDRASILHLAVSANEIPATSSPEIMGNASPEAVPVPPRFVRQKLLDNIFARIVVISISFGAPGGFCTDYPIIQIPLSSGRVW